MSIIYNSNPVLEGLKLNIDAANPKSYPGSGNTVYDMSLQKNTITFINPPVISENSFDFTALDTDGLNVSNINFSDLYNFTLECVFKVNGTHLNYNGTLLSSGNWNSKHWSLAVNQNNTAISTRNPSITYSYSFLLNTWYHVVYRRISDTINFFVNGTISPNYVYTSYIPLQSDATNTTIGRETYANGYFNLNGKIALAKIYDKGLSTSEVIQNFNSIRGRYNI